MPKFNVSLIHDTCHAVVEFLIHNADDKDQAIELAFDQLSSSARSDFSVGDVEHIPPTDRRYFYTNQLPF